jgi:hypothetical protein
MGHNLSFARRRAAHELSSLPGHRGPHFEGGIVPCNVELVRFCKTGSTFPAIPQVVEKAIVLVDTLSLGK